MYVVRFVRYVTHLDGITMPFLEQHCSVFVWIFAEWLLWLLGTLERDEWTFMSVRLFLYAQTMEKLQLYSHQKLCYNSLVSELRGALGRKYLLAAKHPLGEVS